MRNDPLICYRHMGGISMNNEAMMITWVPLSICWWYPSPLQRNRYLPWSRRIPRLLVEDCSCSSRGLVKPWSKPVSVFLWPSRYIRPGCSSSHWQSIRPMRCSSCSLPCWHWVRPWFHCCRDRHSRHKIWPECRSFLSLLWFDVKSLSIRGSR